MDSHIYLYLTNNLTNVFENLPECSSDLSLHWTKTLRPQLFVESRYRTPKSHKWNFHEYFFIFSSGKEFSSSLKSEYRQLEKLGSSRDYNTGSGEQERSPQSSIGCDKSGSKQQPVRIGGPKCWIHGLQSGKRASQMKGTGVNPSAAWKLSF